MTRLGLYGVSRWAVAVSLAAAWSSAGCDDGPGGGGEPCEDQAPAFVVTVRCVDAPLPDDTRLTVRYGGTSLEAYQLGQDAGGPLLFCEERTNDGDSGAIPTEVLVCELYTGQAAEAVVEADGFPEQTELLTLDRGEQGCIVTRPFEIVLEAPDSGT